MNMKMKVIIKNKMMERPIDLVEIADHVHPESYFIFEDNFGRQWKLEPVKSERILMPFIITPLPKE